MKNKLSKTQLKEICKNLDTGIVYRFHENNEITTHEQGRKYPGKLTWIDSKRKMRTFSDKGNMFITKIAICPECGKLRENPKIIGPYCVECKAIVEAREKKLGIQKPKISAFKIAFEITGEYPRVNRSWYMSEPNVFEELWIERMVA